jgi:ketosteroid isomerase-like protein
MTANYQPLLDTRPFFIETKSATTRGEHNKPRDTARAMLDENVEVVRRMWDAFLSGDFDTALSCLACDIEWDGTNLPDGRVGRGHEAVLEHAARWAEAWDDWTVDVEQIRAAHGEKVFVLIRERGWSSSGLKMDERHAELYTVRNGKVVRRVGFSDPVEALESAGASD